jgi:hypothetical protein
MNLCKYRSWVQNKMPMGTRRAVMAIRAEDAGVHAEIRVPDTGRSFERRQLDAHWIGRRIPVRSVQLRTVRPIRRGRLAELQPTAWV